MDAKSVCAGRCNQNFEPCLYVSEDVDTCISELKPLVDEKVSVAKIVTHEELRIVDFSASDVDDTFRLLIALLFITSPTEENYDAYIYTQVICSLIKSLGFDGICYSSCQNRFKNNYAIFNYDKCKVVSSDVYDVTRINYESQKVKQNW